MKAIVLEKLGGSEVLKVGEVPKPSVTSPKEVLIKLKYSGINFAEILARRGLYQWVPKKKGFILGMEGAGIVEEVGRESTYQQGDPVIVARNFGCHAEYIAIDEKYVFPALSLFSLKENAAFTASFLTSFIALTEIARVKSGESILIQAAAGALGLATVQLSKAMGLTIAGTTSKIKKKKFLQNLEIDLAINYIEDNFREKIMEWTNGRGVDIILESVGGKVFRESMKCLAPLGRLVMVGISGVQFSKKNPLTWWPTYKQIPKVNPLKMLGESKGLHAFHAGRLLDSDY
ncbi:MAG: quinone oxidoreductase family protein, partial [Candidatus Hodarchaeales archaeon]